MAMTTMHCSDYNLASYPLDIDQTSTYIYFGKCWGVANWIKQLSLSLSRGITFSKDCQNDVKNESE